jgi:hypothetical protein
MDIRALYTTKPAKCKMRAYLPGSRVMGDLAADPKQKAKKLKLTKSG